MPRLVKNGGSFTLSVPPAIARALGLKKGSRLTFAVRGRELIFRPADDYLAAIPTEDLKAELRRRKAA